VLLLFCFLAKAGGAGESTQKSSGPGELEGRKPPLSVAGDEIKKSKSEKLWAVQPLAMPAIPETDLRGNSSIDAFIQAKLKEKGLAPSPEANRRTLIRRLTFDLHGLPPTPEEVDAFIADESADAYEKLVDRLLASPRYGERWGRHWLDVAHYGETHGYDKDSRRTNSWPYRDYVIKSFNEDKPYGRFIQEQLAGDVLFPEEPDGIVATGFIVAGPWDKVGQVELKEGTMDKKITRLLDRDDMVANTMSTFCSLTVHCARCHNHKFDPISQKDYYGLQAVFAGIDRADRPYDPDKNVLNARLTLTQEERVEEKELAGLQTIRAQVSSGKIRNLDAEVTSLAGRISSSAQLSNAVPSLTRGYHSGLAYSPYETKWVQVDLGRQFALDEIILVAALTNLTTHAVTESAGRNPTNGSFTHSPSSILNPQSIASFGFPRRFKIEVSDDPQFNHAETVADETTADFPDPGATPYIARKPGMSGRYIRITATRLWRDGPKTNDWLFAL
ncbi:MAG TPA: DUF1549 domain-containing protein, partial [Verrucomicrobiae bacterium]|nr:DUF1549 domain-containing protein [Verrucomicrobiae bacterium]